MIKLARTEDGRRSKATVDTEEHARELEQLGYQRVQEVEEHDRGDDRRDADGR